MDVVPEAAGLPEIDIHKRGAGSVQAPGREISASISVGVIIHSAGRTLMNNVIYLIGLIVVVLVILSFFGLR